MRIPENTKESQLLKHRVLIQLIRGGIDEANEWIAVGEQLREEPVDPYTTHVDYFSKKTLEHIQDIEKEIETPQQRRKLLKWKRYVEKKQEKFTYEDWLKVNWALSKVLGNGKNRRLETIERLIHGFPRIIAMPTTTGTVGIMTLNRAGTYGMHAIGLKYSSYYFEHDLSHAVFNANYPPIWFYEHMKRLSSTLS